MVSYASTFSEALPLVEPFLTSTAKLGTAFASMSIRALLTAGADQVRGRSFLKELVGKVCHLEMNIFLDIKIS